MEASETDAVYSVGEADAVYTVADRIVQLNDTMKDIKELLTTISNQLFDVFNEEGDGEVKVRLVENKEEK